MVSIASASRDVRDRADAAEGDLAIIGGDPWRERREAESRKSRRENGSSVSRQRAGIDARELGFKVTILADACATNDPKLEEIALRYAEQVGGMRIAHGRACR